MLLFEEARDLLTAMADELPEPIYRELNGGIILLPDVRMHPANTHGDLYMLGQYHYDPKGFGRYITIYYGSLMKVCGHLPRQAQIDRLRGVLHHELTHHLEHLAGDRSLEVQDEIDIRRYRDRHGG